MPFKDQSGSFLLEALVAILIFAFGILGLVALSARSVVAQSDAEYRSIAANLADEIVSTIALGVDRCPSCTVPEDIATQVKTSLAGYAHQAEGTDCPSAAAADPIAGDASANADVLNWIAKVTGAAGLPGATSEGIQIRVNDAADPNDRYNPVTVVICWQGPKDVVPRRFSMVAYVN